MTIFCSENFFDKFFYRFENKFSVFCRSKPNTVKTTPSSIWGMNHVNYWCTKLFNQFGTNLSDFRSECNVIILIPCYRGTTLDICTIWSRVLWPDVQSSPISLGRYLFSLICSSSELSRKRQRLKKSKNARWETVWVITSFSVNDFKSSIKSFDMFTSHVQRALSRTLSL